MKLRIEVTCSDLVEMNVSPKQLEAAMKQQVESGLDIDGDTLYINNADVAVVVSD